jgi:outer membrane immunogenic protein
MKRVFLSVFLLGAAALALATATTAASAADLGRRHMPTKAPAYEAYYNWSGFYAGINGGGAFGNSDLSNALGSTSYDVNGGLAGGTIGYNWQVGRVVYGLEADGDWSGLKGSTTNAACVSCETSNPWLATARGRIGYAFNRVLPYVTAGGAFGDVKIARPGFAGETDTRAGWTGGGGVEVAINGPWTAKVEYLYADLGSANCSAANCGVSTSADLTANILRGGINYRF